MRRDRVDAQAEDLAVGIHRELGMGHMIAAMRVGEEALGAFRRPFDRPAADPLRCPEADDFLGIDENLRAEAAADIGRDDAQLVLGCQAMEGGDDETRHMRVLARRIERVVIVARVVGADRGPRLHRVGDEAIVDDVELGYVLGVGEGGIGRGLIAERPVENGVVGRHIMDLHASTSEPLAASTTCGSTPIVTLHLGGRGLGLLLGFGDDDGDMIADITHLAERRGSDAAPPSSASRPWNGSSSRR